MQLSGSSPLGAHSTGTSVLLTDGGTLTWPLLLQPRPSTYPCLLAGLQEGCHGDKDLSVLTSLPLLQAEIGVGSLLAPERSACGDCPFPNRTTRAGSDEGGERGREKVEKKGGGGKEGEERE